MAPLERQEKIGLFVGFGVLALGIAILLVAFGMSFSIASDPGEYIRSQIPESADEPQGPEASFRWTSDGYQVDFTDSSTQGNASIVSWQWDFGDGGTSGLRNPQHTYTRNGTYTVKLIVRDGNDLENSALSEVQVFPGNQGGGNSMPDFGNLEEALDPGQLLGPLSDLAVGVAAVSVTFLMLLIVWLVGASVTKAGWNMVRPRPETIRVRIKPKHIEAEPIEPAAQPSPPPPPPPPSA